MKFDVNDIIGEKYGKLTVLEFSHKTLHKSGKGYTYYYLCKCDCGHEKIIDRTSLKRTNGTKSCGCLSYGQDIINKKFGRLLVLKIDKKVPRYYPNGTIRGHRTYYKCQCECGNIVSIERSCLLSGTTKSCGCYAKEKAKTANITHNLTHHRLYNIFHKMRARCLKTKCKSYPNYGGRGITICPEWKNNFLAFYNWAINNGYSDNLSLDRIDVNGNYEPSNCRWTTSKIQNNNKRSNFLITIYNRTQTLKEWCDEKGLNYEVVSSRISRGWSLEDAFNKE